MTTFITERFGGKDMKHDPRLIPDNKAQVASDCELERGSLHPLAADPNSGMGSVSSGAVSIFWYDQKQWLSWSIDTDAVMCPIPDDKYNRAVITQATGSSDYPRLYSDGATYRLGIPKPDSIPSVSVTEAPPVDEETGEPDETIETETISYVYTFVDSYGAEGPPSGPSVSVDRVIDTDVNLILPSSPSGNYNFGANSYKRLYRSSSGTGSSFYLFVTEVPVSTQNVLDNVKNADLQEALPSDTWVGPPDDDTSKYPNGPMIGVCVAANGIMAGFSHATICFSEPFLPHAWPFEYRITLDEPIVGMCAIASGLLVVSTKRPYLVSGVHPASMALTAINESQGLANKRGLVDMGSYAMYPSADGLVIVEGAQARVATESVITYEDWKQYSPSTIEGYHEEGKYIGFYNGNAAFIFDPRGGDNAFIDAGRYYRAGYHDGPSGKLLLNSGGQLVSWGDNTSIAASSPYTWRSRKYVAAKPVSFSAARVEAWESFSEYPVTMQVFADGVLTDTVLFDNNEPPYRRLSAGFRAKIWEFELTGRNPVTYAGLFEAMSEVI